MAGQLSGVVAEWLEKEFGGRYQAITKELVVGVASSRVIENDPERVALVIMNLSANTVYLNIGSAASVGQGIILVPTGGGFTSVMRNDFVLQTYEYNAIASGAGSACYSVEVRRYSKHSVEPDNA